MSMPMKPERPQVNTSPASALLKAMGNDRRLAILCHLSQGEKTVGELERLVGLSQSALSQHLALLRAENLVTTRRQAQHIFYGLQGDAVPALLDLLARLYPAEPLRSPTQATSSQPVIKANPPNGATAPNADGPHQPNP